MREPRPSGNPESPANQFGHCALGSQGMIKPAPKINQNQPIYHPWRSSTSERFTHVFVGEPKLAKNAIFSDIQGILDPRQIQSLLPRFACEVRSKLVTKWSSSNKCIITHSAQAIEKITHMRVGVERPEMARTWLLSGNSGHFDISALGSH